MRRIRPGFLIPFDSQILRLLKPISEAGAPTLWWLKGQLLVGSDEWCAMAARTLRIHFKVLKVRRGTILSAFVGPYGPVTFRAAEPIDHVLGFEEHPRRLIVSIYALFAVGSRRFSPCVLLCRSGKSLLRNVQRVAV